MYSPDRYALALAMLEGDRDARKILADLLEVQGERGLAQWAKGGGNAKHRRLDFAVMLLPSRAATRLAVDFLEHAFPATADAALYRSLAAQVKLLGPQGLTVQELAAHSRMVVAQMPQDWGIRPSGARSTGVRNSHLKSAIQALAEAIQSAANGEAAASDAAALGTPRHWETMALQHLRAVATACQNQARPKPSRRAEPTSEVEWQIERTKILLQDLLTAGDDLWPK